MKLLLTFCFLCVCVLTNAQLKNFTLSGEVKGLDAKYLYIYLRDKSAPGGYFRDSTPIRGGAFFYSMNVKEVIYLTLSPGVDRVVKKVKSGGYYPAKSSLLQFFAQPDGKVHFTGEISDFVDAYPSGGGANVDLAKLNRQINPLANEAVNLMIQLADSLITGTKAAKAKERIAALDKKQNDIKRGFVQNNPSSIAAAWLLSDMMVRSQVSNDEAIDLFKDMDQEKLVSTPFYAEVAKRVDGILATAVGREAPAIQSKNTFNGKDFDLASLRGKYVILDFWGTWCGPCVSGMPRMKEYLDKYKGKLDIVGVAQESDDGSRWRKFLERNIDYHWHQILSRPDEDYILKFSVAGFPTKIIVDPQGIVVARYVGEDEGFYERLDEVLQ